jgi:hypothetical protein
MLGELTAGPLEQEVGPRPPPAPPAACADALPRRLLERELPPTLGPEADGRPRGELLERAQIQTGDVLLALRRRQALVEEQVRHQPIREM